MAALPRLGEGEEYTLGGVGYRVVTDAKVLAWRQQEFTRMGFDEGRAKAMSRWADADLHTVARWLERGCTHEQAFNIVTPDIEIPTLTDIDLYGAAS
jgi:hypothetical protein